jgi:hypothetical protein
MISIPHAIFGLVLGLLVLLAGFISYRASHSPKSKFDFSEAFLDESGKTSLSRICTFVALAVSTWAMVALVQMDKLTEWFYVAYLGAFVVNGVAHKFLDKQNASIPPA